MIPISCAVVLFLGLSAQFRQGEVPILDLSVDRVPENASAVNAYKAWFNEWKRKEASVEALKRDEFETTDEFAKRKQAATDALAAFVFPSSKSSDVFGLPTPVASAYDADNSDFAITVDVTPFSCQGTQVPPIDGNQPARGVDFDGPIIRLVDCKSITIAGQPTFSTVVEWCKGSDYDRYEYRDKIPMDRANARESKDHIRALALFRRDSNLTTSHTYVFGFSLLDVLPAYKLVGIIVFNDVTRRIYIKKLLDK